MNQILQVAWNYCIFELPFKDENGSTFVYFLFNYTLYTIHLKDCLHGSSHSSSKISWKKKFQKYSVFSFLKENNLFWCALLKIC